MVQQKNSSENSPVSPEFDPITPEGSPKPNNPKPKDLEKPNKVSSEDNQTKTNPIVKDLEKPKLVTRFTNTNLVKWFLLLVKWFLHQFKLIPKRFIHFPFFLIFSLLYSATYPSILPTTHSFIFSLATSFVVRYLFVSNNQL